MGVAVIDADGGGDAVFARLAPQPPPSGPKLVIKSFWVSGWKPSSVATQRSA